MDDLEVAALKQAVEGLYPPCKAAFIRADDVHETHEGQTVWRGNVATFAVTGLASATMAYAWGEPTDGGRMRFFAVLRAAQIDSPAEAVRVSILMDAQAVEKAKRKLS